MSDDKTLVERLRKGLDWQDDGWPTSGVDETMRQSADRIEALSAEVERVENERAEQWRLRRDAEGSRDVLQAVVANQAAEIARLREELTQLEVDAMEHYNDFSEWNLPREARNFAFDMATFCRKALGEQP